MQLHALVSKLPFRIATNAHHIFSRNNYHMTERPQMSPDVHFNSPIVFKLGKRWLLSLPDELRVPEMLNNLCSQLVFFR